MGSQSFEFTLWLADDDRELLDWSNALYDAGGDDSHPGVCNGELYATFHREAASMEDAIRSARRQLESIGLRVTRCEIPEAQLAVWAQSKEDVEAVFDSSTGFPARGIRPIETCQKAFATMFRIGCEFSS